MTDLMQPSFSTGNTINVSITGNKVAMLQSRTDGFSRTIEFLRNSDILRRVLVTNFVQILFHWLNAVHFVTFGLRPILFAELVVVKQNVTIRNVRQYIFQAFVRNLLLSGIFLIIELLIFDIINDNHISNLTSIENPYTAMNESILREKLTSVNLNLCPSL